MPLLRSAAADHHSDGAKWRWLGNPQGDVQGLLSALQDHRRNFVARKWQFRICDRYDWGRLNETFASKSGMFTTNADEKERKAKRKAIKTEVAAIEAVRAKAASMTQQIRDLDARADRAADKHTATTTPIQARLSEIDVEFSEALLAGKDLAPALVQERDELLRGISNANLNLETETQAIKKLRNAIEQERQKLILESSSVDKVRGRLRDRGIASPRLLTSLVVARKTVDWAKRRVVEAQREVEHLNTAHDEITRQIKRISSGDSIDGGTAVPDDFISHERRAAYTLSDAEAELEGALKIESAAMTELARIKQAIVDE
jgi:hypothetical protein